jgi:hypothetical protein
MNEELFALYRTFRYADGMSRNRAIERATDHTGYSRVSAYEIVTLREGGDNSLVLILFLQG